MALPVMIAVFIAALGLGLLGLWGALRTHPVVDLSLLLTAGSLMGAPLFRIDAGPLPLTLMRLMLLMMVARTIWLATRGQINWPRLSVLDFCWFAYLLVITFSLVTSDWAYNHRQPVSTWLFFYLLPTVVYLIARTTRFRPSPSTRGFFGAPNFRRLPWNSRDFRDSRPPRTRLSKVHPIRNLLGVPGASAWPVPQSCHQRNHDDRLHGCRLGLVASLENNGQDPRRRLLPADASRSLLNLHTILLVSMWCRIGNHVVANDFLEDAVDRHDLGCTGGRHSGDGDVGAGQVV